tara:strand:- start:283 stop:417 length:135 start_codon:yes stop_codon:yes gene_type:complete
MSNVDEKIEFLNRVLETKEDFETAEIRNLLRLVVEIFQEIRQAK